MAHGEIVADLVERADKHVVDARANERGETSNAVSSRKPVCMKSKLRQQRVAQVAGADDDEAVLLVHAENVTDLGAQLQNVVAVALLAELAEAAEVLTDLRGGETELAAQLARMIYGSRLHR